MPITVLDEKTALVVIDIQKGIIAMPTVHPIAGVLNNVVQLVEAFRAQSRPVVLVRVGWGPDFADAPKSRVQAQTGHTLPANFFEYADELNVEANHDILIHKRQWGAFYGTDLDLQLRRRDITQIVFCGVATSIGVESTARDAWERSYNLAFASDAMTDLNMDAHQRALDTIYPRIGEIGTTEDIVKKV